MTQVMSSFLLAIRVSRPLSWIILPSIFFAAAWFSKGAAYYPVQTVLIALALSFPMSLHGYGFNDVFDLDSDRKNPRKKIRLHSTADMRFIRMSASVGGGLVIVAALTTLEPLTILWSCLLVLVSYVYSVPPVRLRERPPFDSVANGVGYFLLPALMGWTLHRPLSELPVDVWAIAIAVAGIHSFASAMDYTPDQKAQNRTVATVFGIRGAAALCTATMLISYTMLPFWYPLLGALMGVSLLIYPNERLAKWGTGFFFLGFLVAVVGYYYFLVTHFGIPFFARGGIFAR